MKYVRYGTTGIKVSQLAFGCMTYGDPAWHEWVLDEPASETTTCGSTDQMTRNLRFGTSDEDRVIAGRTVPGQGGGGHE